jgi:serine/threonine protein phosphatase 1
VKKMIYAIGDIHGCLNSLERLVEKVNPGSNDTMIFLGDYIDRGKDSKGVVEFLMRLYNTKTVFIKGNHEWMFKQFYDTRDPQDWELWKYNGAEKTLESYGGIEQIPIEHVKFLEQTKVYHIQDGYIFVHGGVKPHIKIEDQKIDDMIWIREEFINSKNPMNGYTVVFGHTPMNEPLILSDKIGIDTGCVYGGSLTCIRLEDKKIFQVRCKN